MDKKLILVERVDFNYTEMFHNESLDDAIINLHKFKEKMDQEYTYKNMVVGKIQIHHYYDYVDAYLNIYREETDEEYTKRMSKEQQKVAKAELKRLKKLDSKLNSDNLKKEQLEYDLLLKKYGNIY